MEARAAVAITGMGVVSAVGNDVEAFWRACMAGRSEVSEIPERWTRFGAYHSRFWSPLAAPDHAARGISSVDQRRIDPVSLNALNCAVQALDQAGLDYEDVNPRGGQQAIPALDAERAGVFIGTGVGGTHTIGNAVSHQILACHGPRLDRLATSAESAALAAEMRADMRHPKRFHPFTVPMMMPNAAAAHISIRFGLKGPCRTHCSACASGTVAIGSAFEAIRSGEVDFALAGGSEFLSDAYGTNFRGFDVVGALAMGDDPARVNRPFDADRSGFLFSQGGAAVLAMESVAAATARGARILARVTDYAETCDAASIMAPDAGGAQIRRLFRALLKETPAGEVDYINAHGTGTPRNDAVEAAAMLDVFGRETLVNSTKSLLGHTMGAAGAIEAVVATMSLLKGETHGCRNLERPIAPLAFVREAGAFPIRRAMTQSFAFGGHNAALLLERAE